ncbi:alpha-L-fucosidase [Luethyella okanaganae]|uniref:alpha-L-fucosidase n=1 Tax=Luethyella okanaganae TaxID=69372 RepID=A0ABW1VIF5_9MICO
MSSWGTLSKEAQLVQRNKRSLGHAAIALATGSILALSGITSASASASTSTPTLRTEQYTPSVEGLPAEMNTATSAEIAAWQKLQFGLFIHWGLFSVAGGVWEGQPVTKSYSEQIRLQVPQSTVTAQDQKMSDDEFYALGNGFTGANYKPADICSLAKEAGMRYVVLTTKHHDGFSMWDTATSTVDVVDKTAYAKDVLKELQLACEAQGIKLGLYYSLADWELGHRWSSYKLSDSDMVHIKKQLTELLTNYGAIEELWFDMGLPTAAQSKELADLVHGLQKGTAVNGRIWNNQSDFKVMGDNAIPAGNQALPWQTPASIFHETWGYRSWQDRPDLPGKTRQLIRDYANVVGGGGNYLLNIGPTGDGSVVPYEADVLKGIGAWNARHPNAVLGATATRFGAQPWGTVTMNGDDLYLLVKNWPTDGKLRLPGVANPVNGVTVDGGGDLGWTREGDDVVVSVPAAAPDDDLSVLRVALDGAPRYIPATAAAETEAGRWTASTTSRYSIEDIGEQGYDGFTDSQVYTEGFVRGADVDRIDRYVRLTGAATPGRDYRVTVGSQEFVLDGAALTKTNLGPLTVRAKQILPIKVALAEPAYPAQDLGASILRIELGGSELGAPGTPELVSFKKPAAQSSDYSPTFPASKAVDGITTGTYENLAATQDGTNAIAWWQVDLGTDRVLSSAKIWNRSDCCQSRLTNFTIIVSKEPFPAAPLTEAELASPTYSVTSIDEQMGRPSTIPLAGTGRYVRIQQDAPNIPLNLSEVELYGIEPPNTATAPEAPVAPSVAAATPDSLNVAWSAPADGGKPITGYILTATNLDIASGAPGDKTRFDVAGNVLRANLGGLVAGRYTVTVSAVNEIGVSKASAESDGIALALESAPKLLSSNRPAVQSSTYDGPAYGAAKAVDGDTSGLISNVAATSSDEGAAWWEVDLEGANALTVAKIWNRVDCCQSRLKNVKLVVSTEPFPARALTTDELASPAYGVTHVTEQVGRPTTIPLDAPGRYVRIQVDDPDVPLALSEVQVYGVPLATAPAAPAAPVVEAVSDDSVKVSWAAPADGGKPITGYTVALTNVGDPIDSPDRTRSVEVAGNVPTTDFTGLPRGRYTVVVSAGNEIGMSPPSAESAEVEVLGTPMIVFDVLAKGRCVAGRAFVAVTVTNGESVPIRVSVLTPYGSKSFPKVVAGKKAFHFFASRLVDLPAGSVTVWASGVIDGEKVSVSRDVSFDAVNCAG